MLLATWVALQGRGSIMRLTKATGKRYATIHALVRGTQRAKYDTALLIEKATGGQVTVAELCSAPEAINTPEETEHDGIEETRHARE